MKKTYIYACLPVLIAITLRLYPYLTTGLPVGIDAWAPTRNTEILVQRSPINLSDESFDGYNNYWPANSLFGAVVSEVTTLPPIQVMAIFIPLTGGFTILMFYVIIRRLFNPKIAFFASLFLATVFSHAFLTSMVTKETYANPLYLLIILIFLHPTIGKQKQAVLFTITAVTLVLTHHITALITIVILFSLAIARLISNTKRGLPSNRLDFLLLLILMAATSFHYGLYAHNGLKHVLPLTDWLSIGLYQILALAAVLYLTSKPYIHSRTKTLIISSMGAVATLAFTLLIIVKPLVPGVPPKPTYYLVYGFPYVIAIPLISLGYNYQRKSQAPAITLFWLAPLLGLEAFGFFGNSTMSMIFTYRAFNFLLLPLAILIAVGLYQLYALTVKPQLKSLVKPITVAAILSIVTLNFYGMYSAVYLQERFMGYPCLYQKQEYQAGLWITTVNNNLTVSGDWKIFHLLQDYFNTEADFLQGLRYLNGETETPPQILFIYDQMLEKNGYVISYQVLDLPENWLEKASQLNLIYSNGIVNMYGQAEKQT